MSLSNIGATNTKQSWINFKIEPKKNLSPKDLTRAGKVRAWKYN